jgi:NTP pyrophosphatase (non-canonical NTP hydrolase)
MNDEETVVAELKSLVDKFCRERNWGQYHDAKELAIGLSTEANELLQFFRFKNASEIQEILDSDQRQEIAAELADVLYFLLRFSQVYEIDLSRALKNKMKENGEKYPVEKFYNSNKRYDEV